MPRLRPLTLVSLALLLCAPPSRVVRGDDIPATAKRLLEEQDKKVKELKEIQRKAEADLKASHKKLLEDLEALEASFKKEAKFTQALAVAKVIQKIREGPIKAQPDPGTLTNFRAQVGKVLYFEVTGRNNGTVWGTGIYTDDSSLAAAAVHAGVLTLGQKAVIKVTMLPGQAGYQGTTRNGITTANWNAWGGSYKVEAVPK
jgi:hypothetical protein